jgi:hypothetical protein
LVLMAGSVILSKPKSVVDGVVAMFSPLLGSEDWFFEFMQVGTNPLDITMYPHMASLFFQP